MSAARSFLIKRVLTRPASRGETTYLTMASSHVFSLTRKITRGCSRTSKIVVLSRGMKECLHIPRETLDFLKEREIAAHVLPTAEAVELYNQLAETEPVGGLFHTTC